MKWHDKEYTIAPKVTLRAIAIVEEHITFFELIRAVQSQSPPVARISMAYAALLRFAGVPSVDDNAVYEWLVSSPGDMSHVIEVISDLLALMVPPKNPINPPVMVTAAVDTTQEPV